MASITSASSSEIVSTRTRVSGATAVMCRVASTPPISGMFRSMTTTSGAISRTERTASDPEAASPETWTPCSSSRFRSPVRNRSWSSTIRTRSVSSARSSLAESGSDRFTPPLRATSLVQGDGDRPSPPGESLGEGREPQVDGGAADAAPHVGCNALAVPRDRHARAERDDGRIDRDDAEADGEARGGVPRQRIAGGRDDERAPPGADARRRGRARVADDCGYRPARRDRGGQRLRLHLCTLCRRFELLDRRRLQLLLGAQAGDEREPVGARGCERPRRRGCRVHGRGDAGTTTRQRGTQCLQPMSGKRGRNHEPTALVAHALEPVECRHRIVQRLRAENDGERIGVTLLVQRAEVVAQMPLRDHESSLRCTDLLRKLELLRMELCGFRAKAHERLPRGGEVRVERIEIERRAVQTPRERVLLCAQAPDARAGPGGCRRAGGEEERRTDACEQRRGSCPSGAHGGGTVPYESPVFGQFVQADLPDSLVL